VILVFSLTVGVLFGAGAYLMLKPDLMRIIVGVVLVSNGANFAIMSAGLSRGQPPVQPFAEDQEISDPLVQAMTLTAIVIGLAMIALVLTLAYRVYRSHDTVDLDELARQEQETEAELEREEVQL
jgi:multicomponent Na+:H+ antiporter subunit C